MNIKKYGYKLLIRHLNWILKVNKRGIEKYKGKIEKLKAQKKKVKEMIVFFKECVEIEEIKDNWDKYKELGKYEA